MQPIKKSFNMEADLAQSMDNFIAQNPGVSATLIFNQAIKMWLKSPSVELRKATEATEADIDNFMRENSDLMDSLAK